ncbi:MAG: hypothetical protein AAGE84_12630 [Cyanobacteria bacterium P01_G01_bin.39]
MEARKLSFSESAATLDVDMLFTWYSDTAKGNCHCRLRIYKMAFNQAIIIVSELPDNPGRSITDEASTLINLVCYKFGFAPYKVMWIEHYPPGYLKDVETYDEVILGVGHISSRRIKKQSLEKLLRIIID